MSCDFKVYFKTSSGEEVRRIIIQGLSYNNLKHEICNRFSLSNFDGFSLCWKDNEGDKIRISSDKDVKIALSETNSLPLKLYLATQGKQDYPEELVKNNVVIHTTVICDECGQNPLEGCRYKCLVCHNYDLCNNCEKSGKIHSEHPMIRISVPLNSAKSFGRKYKNVKENIYGNLKCLLENF